MAAPIFIPPPVGRSKKCERCGMRYPAKRELCPHCSGLSEQELAQLKIKAEERHRAHMSLGKLFLAFALLTGVGLLIFW